MSKIFLETHGWPLGAALYDVAELLLKHFTISIRVSICLFIFLLNFVSAASARNVEVGIAAFAKEGRIPTSKEIEGFEKKLGRKIDTVNWFLGFNGDTKELPKFPLEELQQNVPSRIIPMLTWEPWGETKDSAGNLICPLQKINNGELDNYIKSYAQAMKIYGKTIRLRFGHEMIQDDNPQTTFPKPQWYPWQDYPEDYKKAYIRIYNLFKAEKADNVQFVWAVNFEPYYKDVVPKYYPGQEYVDWIGIDGYNWSGQDFDGVFKRIYTVIVEHPEIYGNRPIMISEMGAAKAYEDKSFNKAEWIKIAFHKIESEYPRIESFYWFNVNKERDWRLEESTETWQAFKEAMQSEVYLKNNNISNSKNTKDSK